MGNDELEANGRVRVLLLGGWNKRAGSWAARQNALRFLYTAWREWGSDRKDGAGAFYSQYSFYFHGMDGWMPQRLMCIYIYPRCWGIFIPGDGCAEMGKESM